MALFFVTGFLTGSVQSVLTISFIVLAVFGLVSVLLLVYAFIISQISTIVYVRDLDQEFSIKAMYKKAKGLFAMIKIVLFGK